MSSSSDTINIKDNRKAIRVTYSRPESIFIIPDGLDLEDKSIVERWRFKYNTLYIHYVDGRQENIKPHFNEFDHSDFIKYPEQTEIVDADDCWQIMTIICRRCKKVCDSEDCEYDYCQRCFNEEDKEVEEVEVANNQ